MDYIKETAGLLAKGRAEEALELCEKGISENSPQAPALWNNKGVALVYLKKFPESLEAFETALRLDPGDGDASYNRSISLRSMERHEDAMNNYGVTYEKFPEHFFNAMNFGNVSRRLGKYQQAIEAYTGGLKTHPESQELMYNRGSVYILTGDYAMAERDIDDALTLDPEYGEAWYCKAICRKNFGDAAGAQAALEKALRFKPPCLNPHMSWGDHPEELREPHGPAMRGEVIKGA